MNRTNANFLNGSRLMLWNKYWPAWEVMSLHEILYTTTACNKYFLDRKGHHFLRQTLLFALIRIIFLDTCSILLLLSWINSNNFPPSFHWLAFTSIKWFSSWFFCRYFVNAIHPFSYSYLTLNFKETESIEFSLAYFAPACLDDIVQDFIFDPLCKESFLPASPMMLDFQGRTQLLFIFTA